MRALLLSCGGTTPRTPPGLADAVPPGDTPDPRREHIDQARLLGWDLKVKP